MAGSPRFPTRQPNPRRITSQLLRLSDIPPAHPKSATSGVPIVRFATIVVFFLGFISVPRTLSAQTDDDRPVVHEYIHFGTPLPGGDTPAAGDADTASDSPGEQSAVPPPNGQPGDGDGDHQNPSNPNDSASTGSHASLDENTNSASGEPYKELYEPTVRPHKRTQVLEKFIVEDDELQLIEVDNELREESPTNTESTQRISRTARVNLPNPGTWYLLPTTAPEMRVRSVDPGNGISLQRTPTGLYRLRADRPNSGSIELELAVEEPASYSGALPETGDPAASPYYQALPAELLRETRKILPYLPEANTGDAFRRDALQELIDYFRDFEVAELSGSDDDGSLLYRVVTQQIGVCRHRAFGFVAIAQALNIRARYVANELHAFVEVQFEDGRWYRVDLGGLEEPGGGRQPAPPRAPAEPTVRESTIANESNQANEQDQTPLDWEVSTETLYRNQTLRVSGTAANASERTMVTVTVSSQVTGRTVERTTHVDDDGRWAIDVPIDRQWSIGLLDVRAEAAEQEEPEAEQ
jgi:transglutaminase-like putative cysteine protease